MYSLILSLSYFMWTSPSCSLILYNFINDRSHSQQPYIVPISSMNFKHCNLIGWNWIFKPVVKSHEKVKDMRLDLIIVIHFLFIKWRNQIIKKKTQKQDKTRENQFSRSDWTLINKCKSSTNRMPVKLRRHSRLSPKSKLCSRSRRWISLNLSRSNNRHQRVTK